MNSEDEILMEEDLIENDSNNQEDKQSVTLDTVSDESYYDEELLLEDDVQDSVVEDIVLEDELILEDEPEEEIVSVLDDEPIELDEEDETYKTSEFNNREEVYNEEEELLNNNEDIIEDIDRHNLFNDSLNSITTKVVKAEDFLENKEDDDILEFFDEDELTTSLAVGSSLYLKNMLSYGESDNTKDFENKLLDSSDEDEDELLEDESEETDNKEIDKIVITPKSVLSDVKNIIKERQKTKTKIMEVIDSKIYKGVKSDKQYGKDQSSKWLQELMSGLRLKSSESSIIRDTIFMLMDSLTEMYRVSKDSKVSKKSLVDEVGSILKYLQAVVEITEREAYPDVYNTKAHDLLGRYVDILNTDEDFITKARNILEEDISALVYMSDKSTLHELEVYRSMITDFKLPSVYLNNSARNFNATGAFSDSYTIELFDVPRFKIKVINAVLDYIRYAITQVKFTEITEEKLRGSTISVYRKFGLIDVENDSTTITEDFVYNKEEDRYLYAPIEYISYDTTKTYWKCSCCGETSSIINDNDSLITSLDLSESPNKSDGGMVTLVFRNFRECNNCGCKGYYSQQHYQKAKEIIAESEKGTMSYKSTITSSEYSMTSSVLSLMVMVDKYEDKYVRLGHLDTDEDNLVLEIDDNIEVITSDTSKEVEPVTKEENDYDILQKYRELMKKYKLKIVRSNNRVKGNTVVSMPETGYTLNKLVDDVKDIQGNHAIYGVEKGTLMQDYPPLLKRMSTDLKDIVRYILNACRLDYKSLYRGAMYSVVERLKNSPLYNVIIKESIPRLEALELTYEVVKSMKVEEFNVSAVKSYIEGVLYVNLEDDEEWYYCKRNSMGMDIKTLFENKLKHSIELTKEEVDYKIVCMTNLKENLFLSSFNMIDISDLDLKIDGYLENNTEILEYIETSTNLSLLISVLTNYKPIWTSKINYINNIIKKSDEDDNRLSSFKSPLLGLLSGLGLKKDLTDLMVEISSGRVELSASTGFAKQSDMLESVFTIRDTTDEIEISNWSSIGRDIYSSMDVFSMYKEVVNVIEKLKPKNSDIVGNVSDEDYLKTILRIEKYIPACKLVRRGYVSLYNIYLYTKEELSKISETFGDITIEELIDNPRYRIEYYLRKVINPNTDRKLLDKIISEIDAYPANFNNLYSFDFEEYEEDREYLDDYVNLYISSEQQNNDIKPIIKDAYTLGNSYILHHINDLYQLNTTCSILGSMSKEEKRYRIISMDLVTMALAFKLESTLKVFSIKNTEFNLVKETTDTLDYFRVKDIILEENKLYGTKTEIRKPLDSGELYSINLFCNSSESQELLSTINLGINEDYSNINTFAESGTEDLDIVVEDFSYNNKVKDIFMDNLKLIYKDDLKKLNEELDEKVRGGALTTVQRANMLSEYREVNRVK